MIPLALTATESRSLRRALHSPDRTVRSGLQIMDLQERIVWDLSDDIVEGVVEQDDPKDGPLRGLSISVFDPRGRVEMDVDVATGQATPPAAYLVAATYGILLPDLGTWVDVPVHMGPATRSERIGTELKIESQSMERHMMAQSYKSIVVERGMLKTDAIEEILREGGGQTRFNLPTSRARMRQHMHIGEWEKSYSPWEAANRIAKSLGWFMWADAAGTVRARPKQTTTSWVFGEDEIVEEPRSTGNTLDLINCVKVRGEAKKGRKPVQGKSHLPASHPLSEQALTRNGTPHRVTEWIDDDTVTTTAEAKETAAMLVRGHARAYMEVEMVTRVNPLLERYDVIEADGAPRTRFMTGSFVLGPGGVMQINSNRRSIRYQRGRRGRR